jgi:hypothetical protein
MLSPPAYALWTVEAASARRTRLPQGECRALVRKLYPPSLESARTACTLRIGSIQARERYGGCVCPILPGLPLAARRASMC